MFLKSKFYQFNQYLRYYWRAQTRYNIQVPFVYNFLEQVIENKKQYYAHKAIEVLRDMLLKNDSVISVTDYGSGSQLQLTKTRRVKDIARAALSAPFQCSWLFNMVLAYKPKNIIEIGTSLGISSLYLKASAELNAEIYTFEGDTNIADIARNNWDLYNTILADYTLDFYDTNYKCLQEQLGSENAKNEPHIHLIEGNFNTTLHEALKKIQQIDLAFVDGNHRYEATLNYFNLLLPYCNAHTILIFDDIYWSEEMTRAWNEIIKSEKVTCSIDLFWCGIVFFTTDVISPEHYTLIRARLKLIKWGWSF